MNEPTKEEKIRLQSYFGFSKIPFTKYMWAKHMFRSSTQSELLQGLNLFLEYKGICLVSGPPGVGKSISLRRLREELDENAFEVFYFFNVRSPRWASSAPWHEPCPSIPGSKRRTCSTPSTPTWAGTRNDAADIRSSSWMTATG